MENLRAIPAQLYYKPVHQSVSHHTDRAVSVATTTQRAVYRQSSYNDDVLVATVRVDGDVVGAFVFELQL